MNDLAPRHSDFYRRLRIRIRNWAQTEEGRTNRWAEYLLLAPDLFHLICRLSLDADVPMKHRAKLAATIAYFVSPIDLASEVFLGPLGFVDDIALTAHVLNSLINDTHPDILRRHWAGEEDVLRVVQQIVRVSDEMVGSGLMRRLRRLPQLRR